MYHSLENEIFNHPNKPFEAEVRLNIIYDLGSYRKENTIFHRYKDQLVNCC